MAFNKNLEAGEFLGSEFNFWLGEKSSRASAAALAIRVAPAVHRILTLTLVAAKVFIVNNSKTK